jgi:hypothetical protein
MEEAAKKYEGMKFLKSVATKCIENYKDILCPTLIIYRDGVPHRQLVRFDKEYRKMTMASFDDLLVKHKMVDTPLHADDEDAKYYKGLTQNHAHKRRGSIDSDEDEREDKGYANNKLTFKYV